MVKDIRPGGGGIGSSAPSSLVAMDGVLFFAALSETNGGELWRKRFLLGLEGHTELAAEQEQLPLAN